MNRRALLGALAGVGAAATAGCAGVSHPVPPLQGIVRRQSVVGRGEGGPRLLLDLSAAGLRVASAELGEAFPRADERANVTVTEPLAEALADAHDAVGYRAAVAPLDSRGPLVPAETGTEAGADGTADAAGDPRRYAVSRSTFNNLLVGDRIEFAVDPTGSNRLGGLITVVREGTVRRTRRANGGRVITCAHEGVGRRTYAAGERLPNVETGRRYRFRVGTGYEGRQKLASVVRPADLPAFGGVE